MSNFNFLEKGMGIVSQQHFVYDFSREMFLMLYSNNWQNFIVWSPLFLDMLVNMCIAMFINQVVTLKILTQQMLTIRSKQISEIISLLMLF